MRYIDKDDIKEVLPDDWDDIAHEALEYVKGKVNDAVSQARTEDRSLEEINEIAKKARTNAINARSRLWKNAGVCLGKIMHDKCWYCEAREVRSDMPVDHYRPKGSVAECPDHPGYWWLAFSLENYRYCFTFCNSRRVDVEHKTSGGKQDHFPIIEPPTWARSEGEDWESERPVLLDPTNYDDTLLLTYHENGSAREVYSKDKNPEDFKRAKDSIYYYHLDHIKAKRSRKQIAIQIKNNYDAIQKCLAKRDAIHTYEDEIKKYRKEIITSVREKAPFCTAARIYLKRYRETDWVKYILEQVQ